MKTCPDLESSSLFIGLLEVLYSCHYMFEVLFCSFKCEGGDMKHGLHKINRISCVGKSEIHYKTDHK